MPQGVSMPPNQVPQPHHMQNMQQVYIPGQMEGQMTHSAIPPHLDMHGFPSPGNYGRQSPHDDRDRDREDRDRYGGRDGSYDEHREMMDYRREKERLERRRQRDRERFENERNNERNNDRDRNNDRNNERNNDRRGRRDYYDRRNDNRVDDRFSEKRKRDDPPPHHRDSHNSEVK